MRQPVSHEMLKIDTHLPSASRRAGENWYCVWPPQLVQPQLPPQPPPPHPQPPAAWP